MLEARDITFAYPGACEALYEGFSMQVASGERVALAAPSGAGKTTLCRILAGYEQPQGGQLLVDGEPLAQDGICPVQLIGQHPELALDPRLRMSQSLDEAPAVAPEVLDALGIRDEWLRRYPHELSGGELQRFCIARAIAAGPRYLIADEVTTMLDALTQAQIWEFLLRWQERSHAGMVVVTHSPALRDRLATRVLAL